MHIPGLEAVAKVSGKPGLWLVAYTKKSAALKLIGSGGSDFSDRAALFFHIV